MSGYIVYNAGIIIFDLMLIYRDASAVIIVVNRTPPYAVGCSGAGAQYAYRIINEI